VHGAIKRDTKILRNPATIRMLKKKFGTPELFKNKKEGKFIKTFYRSSFLS
jgi:hypothetical protein